MLSESAPDRSEWLAHLVICSDCNYDRDCTACSAGGEHPPEAHNCNCELNGTGARIRHDATHRTIAECLAADEVIYADVRARRITPEQGDVVMDQNGCRTGNYPGCFCVECGADLMMHKHAHNCSFRPA